MSVAFQRDFTPLILFSRGGNETKTATALGLGLGHVTTTTTMTMTMAAAAHSPVMDMTILTRQTLLPIRSSVLTLTLDIAHIRRLLAIPP
jgi:hypothetical protein